MAFGYAGVARTSKGKDLCKAVGRAGTSVWGIIKAWGILRYLGDLTWIDLAMLGLTKRCLIFFLYWRLDYWVSGAFDTK